MKYLRAIFAVIVFLGFAAIASTASPLAVVYHYFDAPTAIAASETTLLVADGSTIKSFDRSDTSRQPSTIPCSDTRKVRLFGTNAVALSMTGELRIFDGTTVAITLADILDFDVDGDFLYTASAEGICRYRLTISALSNKTVVSAAQALLISVDNGQVVHLATDPIRPNRYSIFRDNIEVKSDLALPSTLASQQTRVLFLMAGGLTSYDTQSGETQTLSAEILDFVALTDQIIALGGDRSVFSLDNKLQTKIVLFASSSTDVSLLSFPRHLATRKGRLLIADSANDRVIARNGSQSSVLLSGVRRVSSVCVDSRGQIYIVRYKPDGIPVIEIYNRDGTTVIRSIDLTSNSFPDEVRTSLGGIFVDYQDNLYAYAGDRVFVLAGDLLYTVLSTPGDITAVSCPLTSTYIYIACGDRLVTYEIASKQSTVADLPISPTSIAVDDFGGIIALHQGFVTKLDAVSKSIVTSVTVPQTTTFIAISTITLGSTNVGDVLYIDTLRSYVGVIKAPDIKTQMNDYSSFLPPTDINSKEPIADNPLLWRIGFATELYTSPGDSAIVRTLEKDDIVILIDYDLPSNSGYSYCMINSADEKSLDVGFVPKNALSTALPYVPAPTAVGRAAQPNTRIYKFPTAHSTVLASVAARTELSMLTFASFTDASGIAWYRVKHGSGFGFVLATAITVGNYPFVGEMPKVNATIASSNITGAVTYLKEDGIITQAELVVANGTEVEVVGIFNPTAKYTLIRYYDDQHGIIECYVQTTEIEYHYINPLQIVIFVLFVSTILIGLMLLLLRRRQIKNEIYETHA